MIGSILPRKDGRKDTEKGRYCAGGGLQNPLLISHRGLPEVQRDHIAETLLKSHTHREEMTTV